MKFDYFLLVFVVFLCLDVIVCGAEVVFLFG